jgi:hypothetical protein
LSFGGPSTRRIRLIGGRGVGNGLYTRPRLVALRGPCAGGANWYLAGSIGIPARCISRAVSSVIMIGLGLEIFRDQASGLRPLKIYDGCEWKRKRVTMGPPRVIRFGDHIHRHDVAPIRNRGRLDRLVW